MRLLDEKALSLRGDFTLTQPYTEYQDIQAYRTVVMATKNSHKMHRGAWSI